MKKKYIKPIISFEEIEPELLTASRGWAIDGKPPTEIYQEDDDLGEPDDDGGYGDGFLDLD